eukprot:scaffold846_cov252-Pinguiococcus_pyrenoidosus.AAC.1
MIRRHRSEGGKERRRRHVHQRLYTRRHDASDNIMQTRHVFVQAAAKAVKRLRHRLDHQGIGLVDELPAAASPQMPLGAKHWHVGSTLVALQVVREATEAAQRLLVVVNAHRHEAIQGDEACIGLRDLGKVLGVAALLVMTR